MEELLDENTKSGAVDEAAEHPDMTEEFAEVLSTSKVKVRYEIRSGVNVKD